MNVADITIKYEGPDVDRHSISLDDLLPSLRGFYNLYKNVAIESGYESPIEFRLTTTEEGSVKINIKGAWKVLGESRDQLQAIASVLTAMGVISTSVLGIIEIKKHLKNLPANQIVINGGNVEIHNYADKVLKVDPDTYSLSQNKKISGSLNDYVRPLRDGEIDSTTFSIEENGKNIEASISSSEKSFFTVNDIDGSYVKQMQLRGSLQSLSKKSNSGTFKLEDGSTIRYKFSTDTPESMYYDFAYSGIVNVDGEVKFNSLDEMISISITKIDKLESTLFASIQK